MEAESVVQRKIELQSPEDLTFLVENVKRAARERLDEAFPLVDGGEDELRNRISALVEQFINQTFSLAAPNLSINGLSVPATALVEQESTTKYEAFDGRKRRRVADLVAAEEKLLEEVAALKRSVPGSVAASHAARLRHLVGRDDQLLQRRVQMQADEFAGRRQLSVLSVAQLDGQQHVELAFRRAVESLARLKRDMPAVVAKMERARVAGEYVVAEKRS
ncbi:hypothetical protein XA68_14789 [Ophiocordyceps unilateralis]|uniref:Kinetochore protein mis14 n=1 Tax=Ophiocordyceps unilateralis TaxID=268505 RepID=A0A2A9P9C6_OPHUN|nr:hypothetical protein XA68_14789 [Ophiocordyceps unilateralis]